MFDGNIDYRIENNVFLSCSSIESSVESQFTILFPDLFEIFEIFVQVPLIAGKQKTKKISLNF